MMGHKICFYEEKGQLSLHYPCYSFLSAALVNKELLPLNVYSYILTHCILVDSSAVICWASPFVILRVSGLFGHFHSIFIGKSC